MLGNQILLIKSKRTFLHQVYYVKMRVKINWIIRQQFERVVKSVFEKVKVSFNDGTEILSVIKLINVDFTIGSPGVCSLLIKWVLMWLQHVKWIRTEYLNLTKYNRKTMNSQFSVESQLWIQYQYSFI